MSRLAKDAEEALKTKRAEEALERAAVAESVARAGVKRALNSPLGQWFGMVGWEFVANLSDGTTLVREKDGLDTILGVKMTTPDQGPDEWEVAVWRPGALAALAVVFGGSNFQRVRVLKSAADLGAYLEDTEPQSADEPQHQEDS